MTTMVTEVYDALVSAGADDAKARRAAEVMAGHEDRFDRLERKIESSEAGVLGRIDRLAAEINGKIVLLQWMFGLTVGGVAALLLKTFG